MGEVLLISYFDSDLSSLSSTWCSSHCNCYSHLNFFALVLLLLRLN